MEHESINEILDEQQNNEEKRHRGTVKTMTRCEVWQQTRALMAVCVVSAVLGATATLISLAVLLGWL